MSLRHAASRGIGRLLLATAFVVGGVSVARADLSIADYLAIKEGRPGMRQEDTGAYLAGVLEGLLTFNELGHSADLHLICVPQERKVDLASFRSGVEEAIAAAKRERADFSSYAQQATVSVMGLVALNRTFPCADRQRQHGHEGEASSHQH